MSYYMIVDIAKCVGCYNCMVACKDEHVGNSWLPYTDEQQKHEQRWICPEKHERGTAPFTEMFFVTQFCQHCGEAACEKAFPDAVVRRADGIVLLDAEKAKGNRALVEACPYGNISWNEERQTAQKCTMCAHLLDNGWKEPRCVQACPLRALSIVSCDGDGLPTEAEACGGDARASAADGASAVDGASAAAPGEALPLTAAGNRPHVLYRNLYKRDTCFVAGALAYRDGDIEKAAIGAKVRLVPMTPTVASLPDAENADIEVFEYETDFFGEFKIDGIEKNSGEYTLICEFDGYETIKRNITIGESCPCLDVMIFM